MKKKRVVKKTKHSTKKKGSTRASKKASRLLVIHGPNLHLLGKREVKVYGKVTISVINQALKSVAKKYGVELDVVQSNHEGAIVDLIGDSRQKYRGILINPAAYTHTSVAIRDALLAANLPTVEVHLSNIYKREEFRHQSLTAPACVGQVAGFGKESYTLGLTGLIHTLGIKKKA